jgi:hypothetical protein
MVVAADAEGYSTLLGTMISLGSWRVAASGRLPSVSFVASMCLPLVVSVVLMLLSERRFSVFDVWMAMAVTCRWLAGFTL